MAVLQGYHRLRVSHVSVVACRSCWDSLTEIAVSHSACYPVVSAAGPSSAGPYSDWDCVAFGPYGASGLAPSDCHPAVLDVRYAASRSWLSSVDRSGAALADSYGGLTAKKSSAAGRAVACEPDWECQRLEEEAEQCHSSAEPSGRGWAA